MGFTNMAVARLHTIARLPIELWHPRVRREPDPRQLVLFGADEILRTGKEADKRSRLCTVFQKGAVVERGKIDPVKQHLNEKEADSASFRRVKEARKIVRLTSRTLVMNGKVSENF